jgi:hypothetical protein
MKKVYRLILVMMLNDGNASGYSINRNSEITIPVSVEPNSQSW